MSTIVDIYIINDTIAAPDVPQTGINIKLSTILAIAAPQQIKYIF